MVNEGNSLANSLVYTHAQHNNVYEKKNLRGGRGGGWILQNFETLGLNYIYLKIFMKKTSNYDILFIFNKIN